MMDYESLLSGAGRRMQESAIRKMGTLLTQARDVISFAPGYPDSATFAWSEFREIASDLLRGDDGTVLQYGPTRGHRPLLEVVTAIMASRGIAVNIADLLVTTGSQQGIDLLARVLLDPGDVALVELPSYTGAITAFRNVQAHLVGVPQDEEGIDVDRLDAVLAQLRREDRRVKLLYVVPNFQNPTGLLLSRHRRARLLEWVGRHGILLIEDDPYGDLFFEDGASRDDTRPIKADDADGHVVYMSSFSKTLAPGFRVAWLAAPPALTARLEIAKQAEDLCTASLDQRLVCEACRRGVLERRVPMLRRHYQRKRDVMAGALRAALGETMKWPTPRGGFFLWATLPGRVSADALLDRAVKHGVIYVVGSAFFVDGTGANRVRLSFSAPSDERIIEGVTRFAAAVREELAALPVEAS